MYVPVRDMVSTGMLIYLFNFFGGFRLNLRAHAHTL